MKKTAERLYQLSVAHFDKNPYFPAHFFKTSKKSIKMALDLLEQLLPHVKNAIYPARHPMSVWKFKEGEIPGAHKQSFKDQSWQTTQIPHQWLGDTRTVWFRHLATVPSEFVGKPLAVLLHLQEALLFLDGKLYHGLDDNHKEVFLTEKARSNQSFFLAVQSFSGRKRGINTFNAAELVVINRTARALFHGLTSLRELDRLLGHASPESKDIRELIRRTLIFLKYFKPEGEEFPNAIARAYKFLTGAIETEFKTNVPGLVHLIGQADTDIAWLWTSKEGVRKIARSWSSTLRCLEEFPEASFTQSQAHIHELMSSEFPDTFKQSRIYAAEGRWETVTPFWVEPDFNIPSGESLIRNILYGKRFFKEHCGTDPSVAWLPGSTGFPRSLPQILQKSGIKYFASARLLWNDTTRFPYNNFWWQGIDGTKILSHIPSVGLEGLLTPKDIKQSWDDFQHKESVNVTTQPFGYGKDGGGLSAEQLEYAKVLRTITGLPQSRVSTLMNFFLQVESQAENLPVWTDELYLERHRGTYTTQAWLKKANRECENKLYTAELMSSLAFVLSKSPLHRRYPQAELDGAWRKLIHNQQHRILTGTCIADVYEESRKELTAVNDATAQCIGRASTFFAEPKKKNTKEFWFTVFNPLPFNRSEYVECSVASTARLFSVTDESGRPIEHQLVEHNRRESRILCYIENIPAFSAVSLVIRPKEGKAEHTRGWKTSHRIIETPFYRIRVDKKGGISSLYDKQLRRELIERGKRGNLFQAFQDTPDQWDAWELNPSYERHKMEIFRLRNWKFAESGPLRGRIRFDFRSLNGSSIVQDLLLYHREKRIDFRTRVNWKERRTLLKVAFPLSIKTQTATFETQFGIIKRTTRPKEERDRAKFEVPAQQWADVSEPKIGVSLLNDSKYGYDIRENILRLTLIRSPLYPHPSDPWHLNDDKCTDLGEHHFIYSLYPHAGDWIKGETIRHARALNLPLILFPNTAAKKIAEPLALSKTNIVITCLKKAEMSDDLTLRMYEATGQPTDCSLQLGFPAKSATECDLMENDLKELKMAKGKVALKFKPFEIKTLKLTLRKR
jgi:alpha-mannosidase